MKTEIENTTLFTITLKLKNYLGTHITKHTHMLIMRKY